jgi:protein phosphatase
MHTTTTVTSPTVGVPVAGPKPLDSEIDVHGLTHPGKVRTENQDHFFVGQLKKQIQVHYTSLPHVALLPAETERLAFLVMVADGVGGTLVGEEASRFALQAVTRYVAESIHCYYASDPDNDEVFVRALSDAATRCHEDLLRRAEGDRERSEGATTLTLFIGVWPRAYLVQVGDSRYYMLRDGQLVQISRDQTIAQDLIDQGVFTPAQAVRTRWANVLSSAIGGSMAAPVVTRVDQHRGLVHLFCSDGLTKHVSNERIADCLRTMTSARQACEALLQDALDAGGRDNITVVVVRALEKKEGN